MVDLVKLRKKARQQQASAEQAAASEAGEVPPEAGGAGGARLATPSTPATTRSTSAASQPPVTATTPATNASLSSKLDRFKEMAGTRRDGLVHAAVAIDTGERIEVLTFTIAGEHYAAGIERVVEIIPARGATRVPNAETAVRGIISLRGTIVTIMDARARLGHPRGASGPDSRIIVVERGNETLGFEVDRVLRVVKVQASEIEPQPVVHASEAREPILGVFRQASALTIFLDLDKLLA